jgi:hypothetical protein
MTFQRQDYTTRPEPTILYNVYRVSVSAWHCGFDIAENHANEPSPDRRSTGVAGTNGIVWGALGPKLRYPAEVVRIGPI